MVEFLAMGLALLLAAMIPGPDFVVVTKNATYSRKAGVWTALGVGTAVLVHATYSVAGLGFIGLHWFPLFYALKYLGALYLAYLGFGLLAAGRKPDPLIAPSQGRQTTLSAGSPFFEGFCTNLLNPKAILFFVGIFSQVVGPAPSLRTKTEFVFEAGVIVSGWFLVLTAILNIPNVRTVLQDIQRPVKQVMGVVLLGFAIKLVFQHMQ